MSDVVTKTVVDAVVTETVVDAADASEMSPFSM